MNLIRTQNFVSSFIHHLVFGQLLLIHLHFLSEHITTCYSHNIIAVGLPSSTITVQSLQEIFGGVSNDLQTTEHGCTAPLL